MDHAGALMMMTANAPCEMLQMLVGRSNVGVQRGIFFYAAWRCHTLVDTNCGRASQEQAGIEDQQGAPPCELSPCASRPHALANPVELSCHQHVACLDGDYFSMIQTPFHSSAGGSA